MKITIEILYGQKRSDPRPHDVQGNISALRRVLDGKHVPNDSTCIMDTISILEAIDREVCKMYGVRTIDEERLFKMAKEQRRLDWEAK